MAKLFTILAVFIAFAAVSAAGEFMRTKDRRLLGLHKEKLTHFRVYWHDIQSGRNPTSVMIRPAVSNSSYFGFINMIDNPLTTKQALNSTVVGRAQGLYASTALKGIGFTVAMNFAITTGKYNGSTITIFGRNAAMSEVREMPVVGGSGLFRFARGYVEARTKWLDLTTGDATVEYNCYVLHY